MSTYYPTELKQCSKILECNIPHRNVFKKNDYDILECIQCEQRYSIPPTQSKTHIEKVYNDEYFLGGGAGYPNYFQEKEILITQGRNYARLVNKYTQPGLVLDVGAACGFLLKGFELEGWEGMGIEPNQKMVSYGIEELNLNLINTPLEELSLNEQFDLIALIQVIGHFYDLDKALEIISHQLKNDGFLLVESWDMESLPAKLLGKYWHEYSPPSVLRWFSKKSLISVLDQYGFEPIKFGRPKKKISLQHALSLLKSKQPNGLFKSILDKLQRSNLTNINIIYPPVDIFWGLFRKKRCRIS